MSQTVDSAAAKQPMSQGKSDGSVKSAAPKAKKPKQSAKEREQVMAGRSKGSDHLTPTQRRLIAHIASYQVGDGFVAISKREIAERLSKCEKTIDRVVADLRRRGLIETTPRYGDGGGQISNAYRVTPDAKEKYPALMK